MNEPAFPSFNYITQEGRENPQGMTLRDYFAAKALQGAIAYPNTNIKLHQAKDYATFSYRIADAMMEARNAAQ
jgi:hypothetical protein